LTVPPSDPKPPPVTGPFPPHPAVGAPYPGQPAYAPRGPVPGPLPAPPFSAPPSSGGPVSGPGLAPPYSGPPATGVPMTGPAAPGARPRGGFLIAVTLVAVLVSLISAVIAIYAVGVANDAKRTAASASARQPAPAANGNPGGTTQAAPAATTPRAATTTAGPRPTTSPGELDPKAVFTESWSPSSVNLEIHPPSGSGSRNIDLDKPEVGAAGDTADMELYVYNGEFFRFDEKVKVVTMNSPDVQPNDCATKFDTSRLAVDAQINVKTENLTLCINTSFADAQRQGIKWKIVLLHVNNIGADGTVNVSLKAWNVPD